MKRSSRWAGIFLTVIFLITGCSKTDATTAKLDSKDPVTIIVWHYYNGAQQVAFDSLLDEFNRTTGKEMGIYVEGHSQGGVEQLEEKVRASLRGEVGSEEAPDIFSSYADTAYEIEKTGYLADISQYLSEKELSEYVDSYIEEGRIGENGELRIFPTAKSSELLFLNKTDWDKFAAATGADLELLATCEGLAQAAQMYYEWTDSLTPDIKYDGRAMYGRDAMANLFIIGSMQLGSEIFSVENQTVTLHVEKNIMKKLWDTYYVPYVKGYFSSYGRFRSDDVKIGELISFTGSITSSMYFPDAVELEEESYPIDYMVLPAPMFEGGELYAIQQGAGMVVTKSTKQKEYASVVFLKWFTEAEHNIWFGCQSGYLPVKKDACQKELLDRVIEERDLDVIQKTYDTLLEAFDILPGNKMYTNKAFDGGSEARKVLEYHLPDKAAADRKKVKERLENGIELEEAVEEFISEKAFEAWFKDFEAALVKAAGN